MKPTQSIRISVLAFLSVILISSCSKTDFIETPACEAEFTGEITSCSANRQVVYKFIPSADEKIVIAGELNNFAGQEAVINITGASLTVNQMTASESSTRAITIGGTVTACQQVVITITWNSTNYDDIVSSDWTVKNAEGTELAAPVPSLACDPR